LPAYHVSQHPSNEPRPSATMTDDWDEEVPDEVAEMELEDGTRDPATNIFACRAGRALKWAAASRS
jgi:hypothetical protein